MNNANERLLICKNCIFSKCGDNHTNKCQVDKLTCSVNGQKVITYSKSSLNICPKGFWEARSALDRLVSSSGGGCGCGF